MLRRGAAVEAVRQHRRRVLRGTTLTSIPAPAQATASGSPVSPAPAITSSASSAIGAMREGWAPSRVESSPQGRGSGIAALDRTAASGKSVVVLQVGHGDRTGRTLPSQAGGTAGAPEAIAAMPSRGAEGGISRVVATSA